jgi:hypothetical protein
MADGDASEYRIRVAIDAGDATSGADTAVDAIGQIEGATKKATESSHNLQGEQLGSLRTSEHLFRGLVELHEGGAEALAGLATEARIAGEVFEAELGPAAPFLIILSTLIAVGIPALGKAFGEAGEGSKADIEKIKRSLEDLASSVSTTRKAEFEAITAAQTQIIKGDEDQLKAAQANTEELKKQAEAEKELQRAKEASDDAQLGLTIAELERNKRIDLAGRRSGADRDAIEQKYDTKELEARENRAREKADDEVTARNAELADLDAQLVAKGKEVTAQQGILDDLKNQQKSGITEVNQAQDKSVDAKNFLQSEGITVNRDGSGKPPSATATDRQGNTVDVIAELQKRLAESEADYARIREGLRLGQYPVDSVAATQKELSELGGRIDKANVFLATVRNAIGDSGAYDDATKKFGPLIAELDQKIRSQQETVEHLKSDFETQRDKPRDAAVENIRTAEKKRETLVPEQETAEVDLDAKQRKERAQRLLTDRQADREKDEDAIQSQIKGAMDAALKARLEKQLAQLKAEGVEDEGAFKFQFDEIDSHQLGATQAKATSIKTDAGILGDKQESAAEKTALKQQMESVKRQVEQLKAQIAALPEHAQLEPLVKAVLALADPVKEMPMLQSLLAQQMHEATDQFGNITTKFKQDLAKAKKDIEALQRKSKSHSNVNGG